MHRMRVVTALMVAALVPALFFSVPEFISYKAGWRHAWSPAIFMATCSFSVSIILEIVVGLPLYFMLRRAKFLNMTTSIVAGFVIASVCFAVLSWPLGQGPKAYVDSQALNMTGELAAVSGWHVFIRDCLGVGIVGALSAYAGWITLRAMSSESLTSPKNRRNERRAEANASQ